MSAAAEAVRRLAQSLEREGAGGTRFAIVLGSGLGSLAERVEGARELACESLEGFPLPRVPGHGGRIVLGRLAGVRVLVQQGRVHLYEGRSPADVTRAVRAYAALGCRGLLLTNAAGGFDAGRPVPYLMRIRDHLNMQGASPLSASEAGVGCPYDAELGRVLERSAGTLGLALASGVYAGLMGPSYESPAEIAMLARVGADAVGMSTVAEALAGHAAGLRVAALSCISNWAAGLAPQPLRHSEVIEAGARVAEDLARLLLAALPELDRALERPRAR